MNEPLASLPPVVQSGNGLAGSKPELALSWIIVFGLAKLLTHFLTVAITPYEIHRDEFLYLAMGAHLKVWGMDFPPAIAFLAEIARWAFGDTLFAVRFFPAVAGTAIVVLGALLARELGGGRAAQVITMATLSLVPLFVRPAALFHPVVWDQLWWSLGFFALIKLVQQNRRRWWVLLGLAGGFGLLTKFSILFFGFGILCALLCSRHRRLLAGSGPWLAAGLALVIGSPTIVGQLRLHFPVMIQMADLQHTQLYRMTAREYLLGQAWMLGPALLLAITGWVFLLRRPPFRVISAACAACFLLLLVLHGKPYYIGPIYPVLFAAGAAALDHLDGRKKELVQGLAISIFVIVGLIALPMGLPILPPAQMARYCARLGVKAAVTTNRGHLLPLPQDYADMLGWKSEVKAVADAFASLPEEQRPGVGLIARNYGEAGALEFYGPRYQLPRRVMLPDNFHLWPPDTSCTAVVTIGIPPEDLRKFFKRVRIASHFDNRWMVEEERNRVICVAEVPIRNLREGWKER